MRSFFLVVFALISATSYAQSYVNLDPVSFDSDSENIRVQSAARAACQNLLGYKYTFSDVSYILV